MRLQSIRRIWGWGGLLAIIAVLAWNRPWVVVPLHTQTGSTQTEIVDMAWQRLLDGSANARPLEPAQTPDAATLVRARGVLNNVQTSSINTWAQVELLSANGAAEPRHHVRLHLGPVVHGTALRDAAGLSYDDFDTQVDYARAASALNARAVQSLDRERIAAWSGQIIVFTGVASASPDEAAIDVVPLAIAVETL